MESADQRGVERRRAGRGPSSAAALIPGSPAPLTVSITGGSPSLRRSRSTVIRTELVNGSAFSSQTRSTSSSFDTTRAVGRHQRLEHRELLRGQLDRAPVAGDRAPRGVELDVARAQHRRARPDAARRASARRRATSSANANGLGM